MKPVVGTHIGHTKHDCCNKQALEHLQHYPLNLPVGNNKDQHGLKQSAEKRMANVTTRESIVIVESNVGPVPTSFRITAAFR